MSLLSRLVAPGPGEEKLPAHQFMAALAELKRAAPGVTVETIGDAFGLSAPERTELGNFATTQYIDGIGRDLIHDVLLLGEASLYTLQQCADRLVNFTSPTDLLPLTVQRQLQILARGMNDCVLSGCAVTAQGTPDMTLAVAKGAVLTNGILRAVAAGSVNVPEAHATLPRIDMVVVDASGAKVVRAGSAVPNPTPPALQGDDVAIAIVYVAPADVAIESHQILDTRVFRTTGPVCIGRVTTPVVRSNTNAAQTFINLPIPDGLFRAGRVLHVRCGGTMRFNNGSPTVTLNISFGGTTMFQDVTAAFTSDVDPLAWALAFDLVAQGDSDQSLNGQLNLGPLGAKAAPNTGVGDIGTTGGVGTPINGNSAVDANAADRNLTVSMTMSVANLNNEIAMEYAVGELI